ncbi:helix-turn-helix domain-containing protein [Microbacterium sp. Root180]|uniref:helix-turn-helix domain-containing protein n=1 Tax=Microbacterium sp. Root180 TaxID=1736483 RepID=UPI0006FFD009|nr:helix-turn-helix domain-containing protein [Microbacterium sp. Root180]KRB36960.1 hypothetical protein ASD93_13170 [Microbacterium sp. Root180]
MLDLTVAIAPAPDTVTSRADTPFLTVSAAAQLTGVAHPTVLRRLRVGTHPGYRLGASWFIPAEELRLSVLGCPAGPTRRVPVDEAVRALTSSLPQLLDLEDLESYLGIRRPYVSRAVGVPGLSMIPSGHVMTRAVLVAMLIQGRNDSAPLHCAHIGRNAGHD